MGNILNNSVDELGKIGNTTYNGMNSFHNAQSKSLFKKKINTILLNRKDVINGRVTYVNLIKYTCRVAVNSASSFNYNIYNNIYDSAKRNNGINNTFNSQIINIRLLGIRNFLPFIIAQDTPTDSFIYKFDNFILPISINSDYTWPEDFPSQDSVNINKYDYYNLCSIDMPEICAKQYYDNNSIMVDSNQNFLWNYNVTRSVVPNENINNLIVSLVGLYAPDNIYISPNTFKNFDYMGKFMRLSNYNINPSIMNTSFWDNNMIYITLTSDTIIVPFLGQVLYKKITDYITSQNKITTATNTYNLYILVLKCIIINNFILQGNAYRLLTSNDKTLNIGEPVCTCLNSPLGYNLNVAPIQGNKLNSGNYSLKTPFLRDDRTPYGLTEYLNILNNPLDYRIKLVQNILQYYYYDAVGNYILPQDLTKYTTVYDYYNNQITPPPTMTTLWSETNGYSAYQNINSDITLSKRTTDLHYNNNNANIYSINLSLSTDSSPIYKETAQTGPQDSLTLTYSPQFVFKNDGICKSLFLNADLAVQLPYYIQNGQIPDNTIICTNNINVYDNSSQYINIQGIVQNNICGNSGDVSVTFNTYIDSVQQGQYSCFNSNISTGAVDSKTILVSGFNFNVNNNNYLSYSLFSGINGTYSTPLNKGDQFLDKIISSVGPKATLYIKNSPGNTYNFKNNYYILFTQAKPPDDDKYIIMIYQIINGVSILILSSKLISYRSNPSASVKSDDFCMKMDFLSCELLFKKMGRSIYDFILNSPSNTDSTYKRNSFEYFLQNYDTSKMSSDMIDIINKIYDNFVINNSFFKNITYIQGVISTTSDISNGKNYFSTYILKYKPGPSCIIPEYKWKYEIDASSLINMQPNSISADSLYNNGLLVFGLNVPQAGQDSISTTQFLLTDRDNYTRSSTRPIYYILSETYNLRYTYYGAGPFNSTETTKLAPYMYITDYSNSNNPNILEQYKNDTIKNINIEGIINTLTINNNNNIPANLKIIYSAALYRYILFYDTTILGVSNITNEQLSKNDYSSTQEVDLTYSIYTKISNNNLNQINELYFSKKNNTSIYNINPNVSNYNWQVISQFTFNKRLGKVYTNNVNVIRFTLVDSKEESFSYFLLKKNYTYAVDPDNLTFNIGSTTTYSISIQLENFYWFIYINGTKCFQSNSTLYNFDFKTNYIDKLHDSTYWKNINNNSYKFEFDDIIINTLEFDLNPEYFPLYTDATKTKIDPNNLDENKLNNIKLLLNKFIKDYCGPKYVLVESNIFFTKSITGIFNVFYFIKFYINETIDNFKRIYGNFLYELLKSTDPLLQDLIKIDTTTTTLQLKSQILNIANVKTYYTLSDFTTNVYNKNSNLVTASFNIYDIIKSGYFFYEFPEIDIIKNITIDSFTLITTDTLDMSTFKDNIYKTFLNNPGFNINGPIIKIDKLEDTYTIYYSYINILDRPLRSDNNIGVLGENIKLYNFLTNESTTMLALSTDNYTPVNIFINDLINNCGLINYKILVDEFVVFSDTMSATYPYISPMNIIIIDKYKELTKFYESQEKLFNNFLAQLSILKPPAMDDINAIIKSNLIIVNDIIYSGIKKILDICEYTETVDDFIGSLYQNSIDIYFETKENQFYYNIFCNLLPYLAYVCKSITDNINTTITTNAIGEKLKAAIIEKHPSILPKYTDSVSACNSFNSCLTAMSYVNDYLIPKKSNTPTTNEKKSSNKTIYIVITVITILLLVGFFIFFII